MTLTFFIHLIITVFGYIILALSYLGIGWFCSRILKISFLSENRFFSFVWIGWAITLLLLQVLNLFFSINAYSSIPILILGLISAIKFFKIERGAIFSVSRIYLFFLTISVLWVAILSMHTPTAYDSGLYHFNSVRWLNESPIVLGLGNLHGRLAFNQSFFAYVAYLNLYPLFNHGHNIANSFLLLILLAECLLYLSKYIIPKIHTANFSTINLATIFFLPIIIYLALDSPISSPAPDVASSILQILIFIYFIRAIAIDEKPSTTTDSISQLMFILIISATAITIKLSNLFYVISICTILIFIMLKPLYVSLRQISLIVIKLIALPALIIFIWSLRGILLSGCPAYPSTIGCINAHWSVPIESVKNEANLVYSWARLPNETPDKVLNSWDWLTPWFYRVIWKNKLIVVYPLLIFLTGIILSFIFYVRQPLSQKANGNWFLIPVPILVGLSFWFYLAPNIRFAHSLFWIAPIAATIIILKFIESSGKQNVFIILMLFFIINANVAFILIRNPQILISISAEGYMPIPVVNLTEKTTLSGLKVLSPTEGDQCWDSKIPCTPYFNPELNFIDRNIFPEFTIVDNKK